MSLGDVDADGDLDLVIGNREWEDHVLLNLLRQLDTSLPLHIGGRYTLEADSRHGALGTGHHALILSTGRASIPLLPLGTLGIDPARAVVLPPLFIPQPAGMASISLTAPNAPGLVGIPLYAQALMLTSPFQERLTNVTCDVIER